MVSMVKQVIETETSNTELLMTLKDLIEAQVIKEGTLGLQESSYTSAWDEEELDTIKAKTFEIISRL